MRLRIAVLIGAGLTAAATASSHHGFGNFAMNEDVEFTGSITLLNFVNPHSWLHFNVMDENGETVERFLLGDGAMTLTREYTAEDPLYFTESYTGRETLMVANARYDPEPCVDLTPPV